MLGTVAGTSISFGSKYVFSSTTTAYATVAFDPHNANKFLVIYQQQQGHSVIGTVSGSTISFGTVYPYNSLSVYESNVSFHPNQANKIVIVYKRSNKGFKAYAVLGTISGNSITYGTEVLFTDGGSYYSVAFDPNSSNIVVSFSDSTNSSYGTVRVGAISGTTITFGAKVVHTPDNVGLTHLTFDPYGSVGKFVISTMPSTVGKMITGTISGTSATFDTPTVLDSAAWLVGYAFNPSNIGEFIAICAPAYNTNGKAIVGQIGGDVLGTTNLTADNFIGTSSAAYADAATASIVLAGGVSSNQTGLVTTNSTYYVQTDGTLTTSAGTPSVEAGRALSATTLLLTSEAGARTDGFKVSGCGIQLCPNWCSRY